MKRNNLWKTLLALLCLGTVASCVKTGPEGATGPQGPTGLSYKGTIAGYVSLYDQYGNPDTAGQTGITITLDSLGSPIATAATNSAGYYTLLNRFTGGYVISAQSASASPVYGYVQSEAQFVSDTLIKNLSMSAQANFAPSSVTATTSTTLGVDSVVINIAADPQVRDVIVFAGSSSAVSAANYVTAFAVKINANATSAVTVIPATSLYELGFASGSTAYFAVYGEPVSDKSVYLDDATGQNIYTALSTASATANTLVP
jgi:hypothetical protein